MTVSGNKLLQAGLKELRRRLPAGWETEFVPPPDRTVDSEPWIRLEAPDQREAIIAVKVKQHLEPRAVGELAARLREVSTDVRPLIVAPYLSPAVRERLQGAELAYLDLTGNIRIELSQPGLFIETHGADVDPDRKSRSTRSLRGAKAGRIVRALVDSKEAPGVRQLASRTGVDPGYVSRVLALLDREALIERGERGRIVRVDWTRLLRRWAQESPLESRGSQSACLEPRGLGALQLRLKGLETRYAITGELAASRIAPVAPPRLATVYVEDLERATQNLGLRPVEAGANVLLIEPSDDAVFAGAVTRDELMFVAPSQTAADLLTSPGRGPAAADELITWMSENEERWRG